MKVAVVGAGIVGMTSALHVMEQCASAHWQLDLTVISEKFCPENTSYGAGGLWKPPSQEHMSDAELKRLQDSFDFLTSALRTSYAHEAGIFLQPGYIVHMDPVPARMVLHGFHLSAKRLSAMGKGKIDSERSLFCAEKSKHIGRAELVQQSWRVTRPFQRAGARS
ncbi:translation initiation factor [Branchiostoma belcheri]|nr:translation initiation factor [Branchiostoma belcheri]